MREDVNITLKEGYIYAVIKKSKTQMPIGIFTEDKLAEDCIERLGGYKFFKKQKYIINIETYH